MIWALIHSGWLKFKIIIRRVCEFYSTYFKEFFCRPLRPKSFCFQTENYWYGLFAEALDLGGGFWQLRIFAIIFHVVRKIDAWKDWMTWFSTENIIFFKQVERSVNIIYLFFPLRNTNKQSQIWTPSPSPQPLFPASRFGLFSLFKI